MVDALSTASTASTTRCPFRDCACRRVCKLRFITKAGTHSIPSLWQHLNSRVGFFVSHRLCLQLIATRPRHAHDKRARRAPYDRTDFLLCDLNQSHLCAPGRRPRRRLTSQPRLPLRYHRTDCCMRAHACNPELSGCAGNVRRAQNRAISVRTPRRTRAVEWNELDLKQAPWRISGERAEMREVNRDALAQRKRPARVSDRNKRLRYFETCVGSELQSPGDRSCAALTPPVFENSTVAVTTNSAP